MSNLVRQELYFKRFITLDEMLDRIEQVTAEEVQTLAQEFFHSEQMAVAMLRAPGRLPRETPGLDSTRDLTRSMSSPRTWVRAAALALLVSLSAAAWALDTTKLQPQGYVNDFAHALDQSSAHALEAYCASLEQATGVQMAIVLVDSLEDEPVEDVTNRLFRQWGVGKKGKDDGLMLLLAIKDRKQRAEVGYGLEGVIPDAYAGEVLRGIRPILRQGKGDGKAARLDLADGSRTVRGFAGYPGR